MRHDRTLDNRIVVGFPGRLQMAIVDAIFEFGVVCSIVHRWTSDTWVSQKQSNWFHAKFCFCSIRRGHTVTDIIGPQHLKMVLPLFETFWSIGEISLAIITHFVHSWQGLYVAITLPTIAYMMLWYFLADSPRWHMQRGNRTHARKIISEAATINNKSSSILSNDFIDDVCIVSNDGCAMKTRMPPPTATTTEPNEDGFLSLWTCNRCINMILIHAVWGAVLCNFNGMLLNTRNFGADTLNRNVALTGECVYVCVSSSSICLGVWWRCPDNEIIISIVYVLSKVSANWLAFYLHTHS